MGIFNKKQKFKFYFLRKRNGTYFIEKILSKSNLGKTISFNNKSYLIDAKLPAFINQNLIFSYFFDIETGNQIQFNVVKQNLNPEKLDLFVKQKFMKTLISGVSENKKELLKQFILGAIVGALLIAVILVMYFQGQIQGILEDQITNGSNVIIPNNIPTI